MCPSMAWHNARSAPESDMCPQPNNRSEASAWERRPTKRSSFGPVYLARRLRLIGGRNVVERQCADPGQEPWRSRRGR